MPADSCAAVKAASFTFNETDPSLDAATLSGDYAFFTHWTRSVNSNKVVRNYSYCYDTCRRNPIWAAYPLHPVYREGGYGRPSPDPWSPDPALYPTNIAPQPNDAASTFGEVWGCIECLDRVAGDCRSGLPDRAADRSDPLPRRAGLRQGAAQSLRPGILTGAGAVSRECELGL